MASPLLLSLHTRHTDTDTHTHPRTRTHAHAHAHSHTRTLAHVPPLPLPGPPTTAPGLAQRAPASFPLSAGSMVQKSTLSSVCCWLPPV